MKIEDMLDYVLAEVPRVPYETARVALLDAAEEFCGYTKLWKGLGDDQQKILLIEGQRNYDLEAITGARVVSIDDVTMEDGQQVYPADLNTLEIGMPGWRTELANRPRFYRMRTLGTLEVYGLPTNVDEGASLIVTGIFTPTMKSTNLPDSIAVEHRRTLVDGALGHLFLKKGDWQDLKLAEYHSRRFQASKVQARIDAEIMGNVAHTQRVRPVRFGG